MEYPTDGIILIDKDAGETSYGVVKKVKHLLKVRKVGHAGTLDPFATGLLIVLVGHATKLSHFIMSENKVYLATARLGVETDTMDCTGQVTRITGIPDIQPEYIRKKIQSFVGDIEQVPPAYSAVKYKGTRAYKLARKGIKIDLQKRRVTIHSMRIVSIQLPDVTFEVKCSSGTYIRSLAADVGREVGTCAHLRSLRRLASGPFEARYALNSGEITTRSGHPLLGEKMIPLRAALPGMREIEVDGLVAEKVRHGYRPAWEEVKTRLNWSGFEGEHVKFVRDGELVAIMRITNNERGNLGKFEIGRVFS